MCFFVNEVRAGNIRVTEGFGQISLITIVARVLVEEGPAFE